MIDLQHEMAATLARRVLALIEAPLSAVADEIRKAAAESTAELESRLAAAERLVGDLLERVAHLEDQQGAER